MIHAIILAGGSGTRFWPLSRELAPKQLLSIFGGTSLMTQAIRRIEHYAEPERIHVVTGERLVDEIRSHLAAQPGLSGSAIDYVVEPGARNTAAAVALGAAIALQQDPEAVVVVLPSDHLLEGGDVWDATLAAAIEAAKHGWLVTIGLEPDRPETGYGYIELGEPLEAPGGAASGKGTDAGARGAIRAHRAARFVEKPDAETAERFLADGGFLWNSGMLVARADAVLAELEAAGAAAATPDSAGSAEIAQAARALAVLPRESLLSPAAIERYAALPAVPFDKAVLEVSDRVAVVPSPLKWSDVGSLLALERLAEPDQDGNVLLGNTVAVDSRDVIAYSADRLVATLGIADAIVVDTADATLVAAKDRTQDVRLVVEALKALGAPELVTSRHSLRPWGSWTLLLKGEGFQIKTIDVNPGMRLSLQSHAHRSEHWVVVAGTARVERDGEAVVLKAGESAYMPAGSRHRLENAGDEPLKVIEVAVGGYLGEDDIVRYEDDWER